MFLLALRDVADARGGIRSLSRDAHLNRESLYRMLSKSGNPSLDSLAAVLSACGLRLAVQSTEPRRGKRLNRLQPRPQIDRDWTAYSLTGPYNPAIWP